MIERPNIAVIAAVDNQRGFAKGNTIPWHYPEDFRWFKKVTSGHICVMGKHTYDEINQKTKSESDAVLPGRECYVVSSTLEHLPNASVVRTFTDVVNKSIRDQTNKTIFVIGGLRLFIESIALADTVYLTVINKDYGCDKFFPVEYLGRHFHTPKIFKCENEELRFLVYNRHVGA